MADPTPEFLRERAEFGKQADRTLEFLLFTFKLLLNGYTIYNVIPPHHFTKVVDALETLRAETRRAYGASEDE